MANTEPKQPKEHSKQQHTMTTPASISLPAPAKLNLFLHVLGRQSNGYHQLETLFQLIDLSDTLTFSPRLDDKITLTCSDVPGPIEHNLIYRAARLLQKTASPSKNAQATSARGIHIEVTKRIPQGGGLGGGSSNAATTLIALNRLWALNQSQQQLCQLGATLGADVPVFVQGHSAWAKGIGEQLLPLNPPSLWFVLVKPEASIATADVFQHPDLVRSTTPCVDKLRQAKTVDLHPSADFWQTTHNDCQPIATRLHLPLKQLLDWLNERATARLTGTGSTCFTVHDTQASAESMLDSILQAREQDSALPISWATVVRGLTESPIYSDLPSE
jgi:4-diphosphocytidyl-2-C-methyl-D-erythritol kinase